MKSTTFSSDKHNLQIQSEDLLKSYRGLSNSIKERIQATVSCHDMDYVPRVENAGKIVSVNGNNVQIMHNGVYVEEAGYQGKWQEKVIKQLRGAHEPQEEKVFNEALKLIKPGATMIELGSWWCYYSLWFLKTIKNGKAICCEPDPENIKLGKTNMRLNGYATPKDMVFLQAAAGSEDGKTIEFLTEKRKLVKVPIRSVDSLLEEMKVDEVEILHMDIQGAELDALKGARKSIRSGKIRFIFVSTHHYSIAGDPNIHQRCLNFISRNGGYIVAKHTIAESCSGDGLIVASFRDSDKDFKVKISYYPTDESLFRPVEADLNILWNAHNKILHRLQSVEQSLHIEEQSLHIEKLSREDDKAQLEWIHKHPARFLIANTYHVYIKRDRSKPRSSA
jgi:FkbM family methyltransferase